MTDVPDWAQDQPAASGADPGTPDWAKDLSWGDVASQALHNTPESAGRFASDVAQPFIHPIQTAQNIGTLGHGLAQKLGLASGEDAIPAADAVGQYFKGRYGSLEGLKNSLANDPVGVAGDLSMVLTGGETALARAPGMLGRAGEVAGMAGRAIDPVANAAKVAAPIARGAGEVGARALGLSTGAGPEAIRQAAESGYEGGQAGEAFRANMRGQAPMRDAVDDAQNAVLQMRRERGRAYREGMNEVGRIDEPIDFGKIDAAVWDSQQVKRYKGQNLSPTTDAVRQQMTDAIGNWRDLDPAEFHTPEGIDALKQKLGDMRDATPPNTPERVAANQIFGAVRQSIIDQAPQYAGVMAGYEHASDLIKEMEKTLSINPKASIDTTLRKLQSVLRDNVTTAYGRRAELANYLTQHGAPHLLEKLAGQALSSYEPRGMNRMLAAGAIEAPLYLAAGVPAAIKAAPGLATMSPRLMGEAVHGAARAARRIEPAAPFVRPAIQTSRQIGRTSRQIEDDQGHRQGGSVRDLIAPTIRHIPGLKRRQPQ